MAAADTAATPASAATHCDEAAASGAFCETKAKATAGVVGACEPAGVGVPGATADKFGASAHLLRHPGHHHTGKPAI
jgi:hypothetical protein